MKQILSSSFEDALADLHEAYGAIEVASNRTSANILERFSQKGGLVRSVALLGDSGVGKTWLVRHFYEQIAAQQRFWPLSLGSVQPDNIIPALPTRFEHKPDFLWWGLRFSGNDVRNPSTSSLGLEGLDAMVQALREGFEDYRLTAAKKTARLLVKEAIAMSPTTPILNLMQEVKGIIGDTLDDRRIARSENPLQKRGAQARLERYAETLSSLETICSPANAGLPFVLVLDDLHNAATDLYAAEFVSVLISHARQMNWHLLIVATMWPDFWHGRANSGTHSFLEKALSGSSDGLRECKLEPAENDEIEQTLIRFLPKMSKGQTRAIAEHVGGNRLALFEILRELTTSKTIFQSRDVQESLDDLQLKELLQQDRERRMHFSQRLMHAPNNVLAAAYAASCLGPEVDIELMRQGVEMATCVALDPSLPETLEHMGLVKLTAQGMNFNSRDALAAAQRLEFRLPQAAEIRSRIQEVVAREYADALAAQKTNPTDSGLRTRARSASAQCYRTLGNAGEAALRFAGLRAGFYHLRGLLEDFRFQEAAKCAESLATAPALAFDTGQWLTLAGQMRVAARPELRFVCLEHAQARIESANDEARVILAKVDGGSTLTERAAAAQSALSLLDDLPDVEREAVEVKATRAFAWLKGLGGSGEDLKARVSELDSLCRETEAAFRKTGDRLGVISSIERRMLALLPLISGQKGVDEKWLRDTLNTAISAFRDEYGEDQLSNSAVLAMVAYDLCRAEDAPTSEHALPHLRSATQRIGAHYQKHLTAGLLPSYLVAVTEHLETVQPILNSFLLTRDDDDLFAHLEIDELQKEAGNLRMQKSRLEFLIAQENGDISEMLAAMQKQFIHAVDDASELGRVLDEEQAELDDVLLTLSRRSFELSFSLVEQGPGDEGVLAQFVQFATVFADALASRQSALLRSKGLSESRHVELVEEIVSVFTRAMNTVRHWPWPLDGAKKSKALLTLMIERVTHFSTVQTFHHEGDAEDVRLVLRNRRRADVNAFLGELASASLSPELKMELKRKMDWAADLKGAQLMAKQLGRPWLDDESGLWGFQYDGKTLPLEVMPQNTYGS